MIIFLNKKYWGLLLLLYFPYNAYSNYVSNNVEQTINIANEDTTKIRLYAEFALHYIDNKPDTAVLLLRKMILLSKKLSFNSGLGRAYFLMGNILSNRNNNDSAIFYYKLSLEKYKDPYIKKESLKSLTNLGIICLNTGKTAEAFNYLTQTIELAKEIKDTLSLARAHQYLSNNYLTTGNINKAILHLTISKKLFEELKDVSYLFATYSFLGKVYLSQANPYKAIEMYNKAMGLIAKNTEITNIAIANIKFGIANANVKLKQYDKALNLYREILSIYLVEKDESAFSKTLLNIGDIFSEQGQIDSALYYANRALTSFIRINDMYLISFQYWNIGGIYFKQKQYEKAIINYNLSFKGAIKCNNKELMGNVAGSLSEVYAIKGYYHKAFNFQKINKQISDSLFNESNIRSLTTMELNYEFDKKNKDLEFEQKRKELKLQASISEKKMERNTLGFIIIITATGFILILLYTKNKQKQKIDVLKNDLHKYMQQALSQQMNPHFIFNCLSSIHSLTQQDKHSEADKYFNDFAKLMRNNLEYTQKLAIPIEYEIETLNLYVKLEQLRFKNRFTFFLKIDNEIDTYNLKIPALLLQPFIENAIIHGIKHKDGIGSIVLTMLMQENQILCTIEDDGVGRTKAGEYRRNLSHKSMASSITTERLQLLSVLFGKASSLQIIDKMDHNKMALGTIVEFGIPIIV